MIKGKIFVAAMFVAFQVGIVLGTLAYRLFVDYINGTLPF